MPRVGHFLPVRRTYVHVIMKLIVDDLQELDSVSVQVKRLGSMSNNTRGGQSVRVVSC